MSSITVEWTVDKIRWVIECLDRKTGLHGAQLPIILGNHAGAIGCFQFAEEAKFYFRPSFLNNPDVKESAAIDLIRHEYAHYYVHAVKLERFIGHSKRETSHGKDWKWACRMVGAIPSRCYDPDDFRYKSWSAEEAEAAYNAADVVQFDILSFVTKWNQVPILDEVNAAKMLARIKEKYPDAYYVVGDEVHHPVRGHGVVLETIPCNYWTQKMHIRFDDNGEGVYTAKPLRKIVNGIAIPLSKSIHESSVQDEAKPAQLSIEDLFPSVFHEQ